MPLKPGTLSATRGSTPCVCPSPCSSTLLWSGVLGLLLTPPPGVRANARFVVNPRTSSARLEVSRHIDAGGEILVSYGPEYGEVADCSHTTSDVPPWEWDLSDPFAPALVSTSLVSPPASVPERPSRFFKLAPVRGLANFRARHEAINEWFLDAINIS